VHSALRIQIQGLDRANRQLVQSVRDGRLDLGAAAAAALAALQSGPSSGLHSLGGGSAGVASALMRHRRSAAAPLGGATSAAAAVAALLEGKAMLPAEVRAANDAHSGAVAMCLRQVRPVAGCIPTHLTLPWPTKHWWCC
jgi:hypothetical protein